MRYVFPDGRVLVELSADSYRLEDLGGNLLHYMRAEHVTYASTVLEQRLLTK